MKRTYEYRQILRNRVSASIALTLTLVAITLLKKSCTSYCSTLNTPCSAKGSARIDTPQHQILQSSESWESGTPLEVDHHRKWTCGERCYGPIKGWFQYERTTKLAGDPVEPHRTRICEVFRRVYGDESLSSVRLMLDHGAGPFTNLGKHFTCPRSSSVDVDAQVIAVDPLAPYYNSILNEFKVHNTLRTAYCASEELAGCVGENVADFAIIINALDHSKNPLDSFVQSIRAIRIGGISCVYSVKNESSNQGASGFHQWNFDLDSQGHWLVTGTVERSSSLVNMNKAVSHIAKMIDTTFLNVANDTFAVPNGHMFVCFQKT